MIKLRFWEDDDHISLGEGITSQSKDDLAQSLVEYWIIGQDQFVWGLIQSDAELAGKCLSKLFEISINEGLRFLNFVSNGGTLKETE